MSSNILIVDDDAATSNFLTFELKRGGHESHSVPNGQDALRAIEEELPQLVLLDLGLPDLDGVELLSHIQHRYPGVSVIVITAEDDATTAVECMRIGAVDYLPKPVSRERFAASVQNALAQSRLNAGLRSVARERKAREGIDCFKGQAPSIHRVKDLVRKAAASDVTVLISGDSGTGKEVLARALHAESPRASQPFVAVNCGAIPEGLIESEFFGHEKGAFTGANSVHEGVFERAHHGTIFLDEIGELRIDLQVRLLRVLQERRITRVGSKKERAVDIRVIAATHRDLLEDVTAGSFRQDLYYRITVFPITLPPLRERLRDIEMLAMEFIERHGPRLRSTVTRLDSDTLALFSQYGWPGNVRELENVIQRALLLEESDAITPRSLPSAVRQVERSQETAAPLPVHLGTDARPMASAHESGGEIRTFEEEERLILARALRITGSVTDAAKRLGIGRATLYRKVKKYGLGEGGSESFDAANGPMQE